jgi:hypothetical protein
MSAPTSSDCSFCDVEWVHAFERDSSSGAFFQPAGTGLPLSRRPRERLVLRPDGSARVRLGQPDDRLGDRAARWSREGPDIVIRDADGAIAWRIVDWSSDRLIVRMNQPSL